MPSSIFSFDLLRAFARLPARRHAWHALLAAGFAGVYLLCLQALVRVSGNSRTVTVRTLALAALSEKTEVLFLGNSVVEAAIDSRLYPMPVMALPMANGNYEVDEILLRHHLDRLPGLKTVVMQLDATCLGWSRLDITEDYRAFIELGIPLSDIPRIGGWKLRQQLVELPWVHPVLFGARITPREMIWHRRIQSDALPAEPGYSRLRGRLLERDRERYFREMKTPMTPLNPDIIRMNEACAFRIFDLLRQRGVRLIFLRYPARGGYDFFHHAEWDAVVEAFANRLTALPGGGLQIINLADDLSFSTSDFRDTIHLNQYGAAVLARRLAPLLVTSPSP